jgi:hypothetical protein
MRRLLVACVVLLGACTSASNLTKPKEAQHFVLEKDYVRTQMRGIGPYKWVEGLKAGRYSAIGEDDDGIYFAGEGDCVIVLAQEAADRYLQTGQRDPIEKRPVLSGGAGGLWLPKPGVDREPRLFYAIRNSVDGSQFGLVGVVGYHLTENAFTYVAYGSEKAWLSQLKIIKG